VDDGSDIVPGVTYRVGAEVGLEAVAELYRASTLGTRRPVDDTERFAAMQRNANLVVTAWDGDRLVGIARSLTDQVWVTYCCDLAVHADYQRQGIGRELLRRTRAAVDPRCRLLLHAAPAASAYYPRIGFRSRESWELPPDADLV
jgi:GNAT superfamily N-acetyltransferase